MAITNEQRKLPKPSQKQPQKAHFLIDNTSQKQNTSFSMGYTQFLFISIYFKVQSPNKIQCIKIIFIFQCITSLLVVQYIT